MLFFKLVRRVILRLVRMGRNFLVKLSIEERIQIMMLLRKIIDLVMACLK
ncbi:hypothetical protein SAMN03080615_01706 [Amphritea atlantica]|uniref:Uncharacterized protein n=1 Tax=Amphritea atlantica TaxID=355243 RepID=A0A1H9GIR9_9GAMM|nr:hypothetical protein SAMN03080615_01706 [Amphritea atlantica]